jgi:hydrogenase-4 membrane subunit HyfE
LSLRAGKSCSIPPLIRLRRTLERGRRHPILGPIVLILLVLLLAMVFMHAAHDEHGTAVEAGFFCLAIVTMLGPLVVWIARAVRRSAEIPVYLYRGPPTRYESLQVDPLVRGPGWREAPLRR